jgi:hypothetical protein
LPKPLRMTGHARTVMVERELAEQWIELAARAPQWEAPDPRPGVVRRFRVIPERGDRILRVACVETPDEIRILSAFLDRRARKPE